MERILVITNADAGSNDDAALITAVETMRDLGTNVEVAATSDPDELDGVLAARDGRVIIVAGGDGSLHAVVAALHGRGELAGVVLGLIPLGTGNDFARGVGLPLDPAEAAQVGIRARPTSIDLIVDDHDGVVVNAVHIGVGAEAGREAKTWKPRLGKLGYAVGAVIAGVRTEGHRLRVEADGVVVADGRRLVLQVGIGNGSFVGGGTELTPGADPTDGAANVLVSFAVAPLDRLRYAVRLRRGNHDDRGDVRTLRAGAIRVSGEPFWCNADGELSGPFTARTWTIEPGAVTMRVPARDEAP